MVLRPRDLISSALKITASVPGVALRILGKDLIEDLVLLSYGPKSLYYGQGAVFRQALGGARSKHGLRLTFMGNSAMSAIRRGLYPRLGKS